MKTEELKKRFLNACAEVEAAEEALTEIDSKFGDADHGLTMVKIAEAIKGACEEAEGGVKALLDEIATAVLMINGGSAVPLWNTWLDGLQEAAPEGDEVSADELKAMFENALSEFEDMSGAKLGEKTMMDAFKPACEAACACDGDEAAIFAAAAEAALDGAEKTKNYVAKFGRAKSYGEKTLGTPDAGATSMACFFKGLAE